MLPEGHQPPNVWEPPSPLEEPQGTASGGRMGLAQRCALMQQHRPMFWPNPPLCLLVRLSLCSVCQYGQCVSRKEVTPLLSLFTHLCGGRESRVNPLNTSQAHQHLTILSE